MFVTIPAFIVTALGNFYINTVSAVGGALPVWFSQGMTGLFEGNAKMNNFIPIWPHPEMNGIVSNVGLLTIVGFLALTIEILMVIGIFIGIAMILIRILPWNTQE